MKTKICYKCKKELSILEFLQYKSGYNKGYYHSYCYECEKEYKKEYDKEYHKRKYVREKINIAKKNWADNNPDKVKKYSKQYHMEHKEIRKIYAKKYSSGNREEINKRRKRYYNKNKDKFKIYSRNRLEQTKELTPELLQQVYDNNIKQFGKLTCYLCEKPILKKDKHLDHKVPLSRGGGNDLNNLAIACKSCNCQKWILTEGEYRAEVQIA